MVSEATADDKLRAVIRDTLASEPGSTLTQVQTRLHARLGRPLEPEEIKRLHDIYADEGYAAGAASIVSDREERATTLASLSHTRPNLKELVGLAAGILPFFLKFQSGAGARPGAATSYFDLIAIIGGIVALFSGLGAAFLLERGPQRRAHLGLVVVILVLGVYQLLVGLGLLHKLGLFQ
jgi:hypothetical protein